MPPIFKRLSIEFINVIPAIIYFAVSFNLIHLATGLMLRPGEVRYTSYLTMNLGALIVGKVILITNDLPFINLFPNKPLIYNIIWKFFLYNICVVIAWSLETFIHEYYFFFKDALAAWHQVLYDFTTPFLWSAQLSLWMVFLVYVVFSELIHAIGQRRVLKMLFG